MSLHITLLYILSKIFKYISAQHVCHYLITSHLNETSDVINGGSGLGGYDRNIFLCIHFSRLLKTSLFLYYVPT